MMSGKRVRRLFAVSVFGFASGLPFSLSDATLQAWLATSSLDLETIGLLSLVSLPYALKFLWAPLIDRYRFGFLDRRRAWMFVSQLVLGAFVVVLAGQNPDDGIGLIAWLALGIAFASATLDIAIDAYRAEILEDRERGLGAGLSVAAYKCATIISGAGALVLADQAGFDITYYALGGLIFVGLIAIALAPKPPHCSEPVNTLRDAFFRPLFSFLERPQAIALLALIFLYKLGDAAAGRLSVTFLLRALEFSLTDIGALYKGLGFGASIVGGILGGAIMLYLGLYRSLIVFAVLQALSNLGFVLLATSPAALSLLAGVVVLENLSGGMGTAAFVALLMALCDRRYTATQFALTTGVASVGRIVVGPPAAYLASTYGWAELFTATVVLCVPAVVLLFHLRPTIGALDEQARENDRS